MKAVILQCDNVPAKFQPQFGDYPAMNEQMFDAIDLALSFDTYDCRQGQFPDDINAYDFYLITGSKESVYILHFFTIYDHVCVSKMTRTCHTLYRFKLSTINLLPYSMEL